jgi:hypothetical protein
LLEVTEVLPQVTHLQAVVAVVLALLELMLRLMLVLVVKQAMVAQVQHHL